MATIITTPNGSGPLLERARAKRGLSLEDVARTLDMEPADVADLERDGIGGSTGLDEIYTLGVVYGVRPSTIAEAAQRPE